MNKFKYIYLQLINKNEYINISFILQYEGSTLVLLIIFGDSDLSKRLEHLLPKKRVKESENLTKSTGH